MSYENEENNEERNNFTVQNLKGNSREDAIIL